MGRIPEAVHGQVFSCHGQVFFGHCETCEGSGVLIAEAGGHDYD